MTFQVERLLLVCVLVLVLSVVIHLWDTFYFTAVFAVEDGPIEYATALFLLAGGVVLMTNAAALLKRGNRVAAAMTALYGLLFFFGAGEEISWGQRLFGLQTSEYFLENNHQDEINVHNLVIGDTHLAETLFGNALTAVILLYLVVLPLLCLRIAWLRRITDRLAVPVPRLRHAALALFASIVIGALDQERKWEVYELIFSLLMLSIFLRPQNPDATR